MPDVIVVGAGPAGSTTARVAASHGLDVLVLDKRKEVGVPVQCGEFIASKEEILGIFPKAKGMDEMDFIHPSLFKREIEGIRIFAPSGRDYWIEFDGFTVNRDGLDKHLASLAEQAGARIETGTVVNGVSEGIVTTNKGTHQARVIVGADGPMSTVARSVGLEPPTGLYPAITCQVDGDFEPVVEMYFGSVAPGGYAWVIPKRSCANVGLGASRKYGQDSVRKRFNDFLASKGFTPRLTSGGLVPVSGPVDRSVAGNVILVGDAAGHVMATNGGGVNVAMICGRIAGESVTGHLLKKKPLSEYERRWRDVVEGPLQIAVKTKRLADRFFGSDRLLEFAMRLMGPNRMARAIRCKRVFRN